MKKFLGKLWKILPALLFFISCGAFMVYATSNNGFFFNKYNTDILEDNTLTDSDWNKLMGDLDKLVPDGAVMAFLTDNCPDGWSDFSAAEGRFLMGASSKIGSGGGHNSITLTGGQLPSHSHYIAVNKDATNSDRNLKDHSNATLMGVGILGGYGNYYLKGTDATANVGKTSGVGNGNPINITNPYIKVHYCVKGNYNGSTYTVTITSHYGGTANPQSITEYSGASISRNLNKITIGQKTVTLTANDGYALSGLNTNCGNKLTKNCTIVLTWKSYGGGGGGGGCFLKGTHVLMKNGYKNIENIKVGDTVVSYNEDTNSNEYSKVTKVFIHKNNNNDLYQLTINGDTLKVTNIHPFYVKRDGSEGYQWIEAQNLKIGDEILLYNGTYETIEKIVHYPYQGNVYNIEVENMHNYYVDKGYLVHNKNNELDVYDDRIGEL